MPMLRLTVPLSWPLEDFYARSAAIIAQLRVRWGAAGFGYAAWEAERPEAREVIYAHSRRYVGYDAGLHAARLDDWHARMRSVNWLTIVGGAFSQQLAAQGISLPSDDKLAVRALGPNTVIQAGPQPQAGDINRLDVPAAYRQVDALLRPLRAGDGYDFRPPWNEDTTTAWLTRFERPLTS